LQAAMSASTSPSVKYSRVRSSWFFARVRGTFLLLVPVAPSLGAGFVIVSELLP
jgi:hypothetical protein